MTFRNWEEKIGDTFSVFDVVFLWNRYGCCLALSPGKLLEVYTMLMVLSCMLCNIQ